VAAALWCAQGRKCTCCCCLLLLLLLAESTSPQASTVRSETLTDQSLHFNGLCTEVSVTMQAAGRVGSVAAAALHCVLCARQLRPSTGEPGGCQTC
jgi:hypothetical protein